MKKAWSGRLWQRVYFGERDRMKRDSRYIERTGGVTLNLNYYDGQDHYSEGVHEDILLDYVKNNDESSYDGLILGSRLWSVMYHLSKRRKNIVSFLPIDKSMSVLEIGAGCGAVTGALSDMAKRVTCIDLSKKRSLINAERHRDRENIDIIVGNFREIEPELDERYDVITLIGVLEYAESYIGGKDPYLSFIKRAASHLTENGRLIIAIENKYGLKYFAGCKEDHTGRFFEGLEGYSRTNGVKTFGREGLRRLLEGALMEADFYYPYPDYKLPFAIYSDKRLPEAFELNRNLNNYDADRIVVFDEEKVFDELIRDGLFREFSNSFLVIASPRDKNDKTSGFDRVKPVYAKFSDERNRKHRIATVISEDEKGQRSVYKKALSKESLAHIENIYDKYLKLSRLYEGHGLSPNRCKPEGDRVWLEYLKGITMEEYLDELDESGEYERMLSVIKDYAELLASFSDKEFKPCEAFSEIFSTEYGEGGRAAEVSDIDLIFSNILFEDRTRMEKRTVLDYEWTYDFLVPVNFIIYRSLFYYLREREKSGFCRWLSETGRDIYKELGISRREREEIFPEMEKSFQLYLKKDTTSFELLHEVMPVSTVSLEDCVRQRLKRGNSRNPQVYFSREARGNFQPSDFINVLGEYNPKDMSLSLTIELDSEIRALRVDPAEYPCIVRIVNAQLEHNGAASLLSGEGNIFSTNGRELSEKTEGGGKEVSASEAGASEGLVVFFGHDDPQLLLKWLPEGKKVVRLSYIIEELSQETVAAMAGCFERLETEVSRAREAQNGGGLYDRFLSKFKRT